MDEQRTANSSIDDSIASFRYQTIAATAAKLGVRLYHYLRDRLRNPESTPSLAELIRQRSHTALPALP
jgi:hypothetical protein